MSGPSSFFDRLVEATGLSPIFARKSIVRACERSGISVSKLDPNDIEALLPHLEQILRVYLDPREVPNRLATIRRLR